MSEDYAYGREDGYADAQRGQVALPADDDDYRLGYEQGVMDWRREAAVDGDLA